MNQVKITVLKTTLDEELAAQYGAPGLTACPMMEAGQIFYADYANPKAFVTKHGKPFTNMFSLLPMVLEKMYSISATGFVSPALPSVPATMVCVL